MIDQMLQKVLYVQSYTHNCIWCHLAANKNNKFIISIHFMKLCNLSYIASRSPWCQQKNNFGGEPSSARITRELRIHWRGGRTGWTQASNTRELCTTSTRKRYKLLQTNFRKLRNTVCFLWRRTAFTKQGLPTQGKVWNEKEVHQTVQCSVYKQSVWWGGSFPCSTKTTYNNFSIT